MAEQTPKPIFFSNYTVVVPFEGEYAIYNKINGAIVLLEQANVIEDKRGHWLCVAADQDIITYLNDNQFFVSDEYVQNIIRSENQLVEDYNDVTLVISTTELCNCKCSYCYQRSWPHTIALSETEYMNWILEYIDRIVKNADTEGKLTIRYFGGEPLLKADFMLSLNRGIERIIQSYSKNITIRYEMDSNCTLLTRSILEQFDNLSIATTLTLPSDHDALRSGTFQQVIARLTELSDMFALPQYRLNIGYNAHHANIADFREFLELIKYHKIPCEIYVANVVNYEGTDFVNLLSEDEFETIYCNQIIPSLMEFGYQVNILPPSGLHRKCRGINIVNRKFFSNGTQTLCSYFTKKENKDLADFPMAIAPHAYLDLLPEKCIKCYDYPHCGGERPCIKCDDGHRQSKTLKNRIRLFLDMQASK